MSWRQNMGAEIKKTPLATYMQKVQKVQKVALAPFTDITYGKPKVKKLESPGQVNPKICYCCGGQSFWRLKKRKIPCRWICLNCHKPEVAESEIEWLK